MLSLCEASAMVNDAPESPGAIPGPVVFNEITDLVVGDNLIEFAFNTAPELDKSRIILLAIEVLVE